MVCKTISAKMLLLLIIFIRELHHIGNVEIALSHVPVSTASVIIVRNRVVGDGQSSQVPGGGGK